MGAISLFSLLATVLITAVAFFPPFILCPLCPPRTLSGVALHVIGWTFVGKRPTRKRRLVHAQNDPRHSYEVQSFDEQKQKHCRFASYHRHRRKSIAFRAHLRGKSLLWPSSIPLTTPPRFNVDVVYACCLSCDVFC